MASEISVLESETIPTGIDDTLGEEESVDQEDIDEAVNTDLHNRNQDNCQNKYVSTLPRRVLPYPLDNKSTKNFLNEATAELQEEQIDYEVSNGSKYTALDSKRMCYSFSSEVIYRNCNSIRRPVSLQTLIRGTINMSVVDLTCPSCCTEITFDRRDQLMFAASKMMIYHR